MDGGGPVHVQYIYVCVEGGGGGVEGKYVYLLFESVN